MPKSKSYGSQFQSYTVGLVENDVFKSLKIILLVTAVCCYQKYNFKHYNIVINVLHFIHADKETGRGTDYRSI